MPVAGGAVLRRTSSSLKSVCVSSVDFGPRSRDLGGAETYADVGDVCRHLYRDRGNRFVGPRVVGRDAAVHWVFDDKLRGLAREAFGRIDRDRARVQVESMLRSIMCN